MKKVIVGIVSAMAIIAMCLTMAACNSGTSYKVSAIEMSGTTYNVGDEVPGMGTLKDDYMVITIKDGGKYTIESDGESEDGKYEEKDGKYIFDGMMEATIDGDTLTIDMGYGMKVILKK